MITTVKRPSIVNGDAKLLEIGLNDIVVPEKSLMSIDGSTANTGISLVRVSDNAMYATLACLRETNESPVEYKVRLKKLIKDLAMTFSMLDRIYYEEPFAGYANATKNLFMLRTSVDELIVENAPLLDYIKKEEINNLRWKKLLLYPDKCPQGTDLQKAAVKKRILQYYPWMEGSTQDEFDAYGMAIAAASMIRSGNEEDLASKKKATPFKYEVSFVAADEDEAAFNSLYDAYKGPAKLLDNGISYSQIKSNNKFEKHIYESMGQDDKVLVIRFPAKGHGDIVLKYRLGALVEAYDYIYAIVWRANRKIT